MGKEGPNERTPLVVDTQRIVSNDEGNDESEKSVIVEVFVKHIVTFV